MMPLGTITAAASSALIITVASQCARNMIQTAGIVSTASKRHEGSATSSSALLDNLFAPLDEPSPNAIGIADRLRKLKREDLLRVFAESRAPTQKEVEEFICSGDRDADSPAIWDGVLLDNNSWVMDLSSNVMTHWLFGGIALPWRLVGNGRENKGRWKGKAFMKPQLTPAARSAGKGVNRFGRRNNDHNNDEEGSDFFRHEFDYSIEDSKLLPGSKSLCLVYSGYQSLPVSLWHSMNDELRVLEVVTRAPAGSGGGATERERVLIGMGWMGWSGGQLNCSPFLLEQPRCRRVAP